MPPLKHRPGYAGLYIHFPYCVHKCSYCDFFSVGIGKGVSPDQKELFSAYKKELDIRIELEPGLTDYQYDTIFIGGGTPSIANLGLLADFIEYAKSLLNITQNVEFTMEANPEDLSKTLLSDMHSIGVNRVNVGVQSFNKELLSFLDRFNEEEKYSKVLELLSSSPIKRYGIDLIYGIPGQKREDFFKDVDLAVKAEVTHLSMYSLTAEKNTEYEKKVRRKETSPPNEEFQTEILNILPGYMKKIDYYQYEVSNYCKAGEESRHNLKYWLMEKYIGLGPGAHGFTDRGRYFNVRSIENYKAGNFGLKYEAPSFLDEVSLCVFRIFQEIDMNSIYPLIPDKADALKKILSRFQKEGLAEWKNDLFKWKKDAVFQLDNYIAEIASI